MRYYVCPSCGKGGTLWREVWVQGWEECIFSESADGDMAESPGRRHRDVDWSVTEVQPLDDVGCSCGWAGGREKLVLWGPPEQPQPNPDQTSLA